MNNVCFAKISKLLHIQFQNCSRALHYLCVICILDCNYSEEYLSTMKLSFVKFDFIDMVVQRYVDVKGKFWFFDFYGFYFHKISEILSDSFFEILLIHHCLCRCDL